MSVFQDSYLQLGHEHGPPDGGRACAPLKSINIALLTEGELALLWIDSERQNNNTNATPTFDHPRHAPALRHSLSHSNDRRVEYPFIYAGCG